MIEDVYWFQKDHFRLANKIYDRICLNGIYKVICIGSISGTGKSETALILSNKLNDIGINTRVISLDAYYVSSPEQREDWRKENNYIGPKEIDWVAIKKFIYEHKHYDTFIIEGLYALYFNNLNSITSLGVYIDRTLKDTYKFRKDRNKEDPDTTWRKYVLKKECEEIIKTKDKADLIL